MEINGFIGLAISVILFTISLIFRESIKQIIKSYFSNITQKKIDKLFYMILLFIVVVPFSIGYFPSFEMDKNVKEEVPIGHEKSKEEIYVEAGMAVVDEVQKAIAQKKKNDSLKIAGKQPNWVYQIGRPKINMRELWDAYEPLQDLSNLYVFKESKKSYIIIKDDGHSKQQLEDSLEAFKAEIQKFETRVDIINLTTFCKAKEGIKQGKRIRIRKENILLFSLECD